MQGFIPDDIWLAVLRKLAIEQSCRAVLVNRHWFNNLAPRSCETLDLVTLSIQLETFCRKSDEPTFASPVWVSFGAARAQDPSHVVDSFLTGIVMRRIAHVKHLILYHHARHIGFVQHLNPNNVESLIFESGSRRRGYETSGDEQEQILALLKLPWRKLKVLKLCSPDFQFESSATLLLETISTQFTTLEEIGFKPSTMEGAYTPTMLGLYKKIAQSNPGLRRVEFNQSDSFDDEFHFLGVASRMPSLVGIELLPRRCEAEMGIPISNIRVGYHQQSFWQYINAHALGSNIPLCDFLFNASHPEASIHTISSIIQGYLMHIFPRYDGDATTGPFLRWIMQKLQHFLLPNEGVADLLQSPDAEKTFIGIKYLQAYLQFHHLCQRMVKAGPVQFPFGDHLQPVPTPAQGVLAETLSSLEKILRESIPHLPQHLSRILIDEPAFIDSILSNKSLEPTFDTIISHISAHSHRLGEFLSEISPENLVLFLRHPQIEASPNIAFYPLLCVLSTKGNDATVVECLDKLLTSSQRSHPEGIHAPVFSLDFFTTILKHENLSRLCGSCFVDCDLLLLSHQFAALFEQHDEYIPNVMVMIQAFSKRFFGSETITGELKESLARFLYMTLATQMFSGGTVPPMKRFNLLLSLCEPPRVFLDSITRSGLIVSDLKKRHYIAALKQAGYLN